MHQTRKKPARHVRPVIVVFSALLMAAACSSTKTTNSGDSPGTAAPRYGGTLVVAGGDPGMLNPALTPSGTTHPVTGQIFNGLVRLDRGFKPQPDLAQSWQVSSDGRNYTFKLAPGIVWHDGMPFSSADVKFSFEQVLLKLHPRTRSLAPMIEGIDTPDDATVVFRLNSPYTPFLQWLNEDNGAILPKHLYEGTDPLTNPANAKPVGTGPFKFESAVSGDRVTLVRNPTYFKKGLPHLDGIVFRIIPSPPQALQAFLAGEVNLLLFPSPPDVEALKARPSTVVTEDGREGLARVIRLIPNLRRKPFDDVRVRQAIAYAVDRDFISKAAYANTLAPATGPMSRHLPPFYTADVTKYPRDLNRAKALLDQAGLKPDADGVRLRTSFMFDQPFARVADLLKQELGEVGIVLDLQLTEFNTWVKKLYVDWDFDLGYSQFSDPPDPDIGMRGRFSCANIVKAPFANGGGYCNPKVDELFTRAAAEPEGPKRIELYREIQRTIVDDQNQIFLVDGIGPYAYDTSFSGVTDAGSLSAYYFGETTWWTKGSATPTSTR